LTFGNAWFADIYRNLSPVCCSQNLRKASPVVLVHLQGIGKSVCRQIGQIGAIKDLSKSVAHIRYRKILPAFLKFIKKVHNLSQSGLVGKGTIAVISLVSVLLP